MNFNSSPLRLFLIKIICKLQVAHDLYFSLKSLLMSVLLAKRLITGVEYHKMAEVGILKDDDRVELINGEIIEMSPIGSKHAGYLSIIDELLRDAFGKKVQINNQSAFKQDDYSEPEPDLMVLKRRKDFYINGLPTPKDIFLIIEVSDSTLEKDRKIKAPLYAKANIPEYWILNIPDRQLECYANPRNGKYQSHLIFSGRQMLKYKGMNLPFTSSDIFILNDI